MNALNSLIKGFSDGGVVSVANYPGYFSHDVFFELGGESISVNEKTAFETAFGASLAGVRSLVTMKNVGLSACADQFLHATLTGVHAGLVLLVTDDTKVVASQERQDSRHYRDFNTGLWLEPSSPQMAYDMAYESFELSERFDIPVVIRLTSQFFELEGDLTLQSPQAQKRIPPEKNPSKFIAYPNYWSKQHTTMQKKTDAIQEYVDKLYANSVNNDHEKGDIIVGCNDEELATKPFYNSDVLLVNHYPLPVKAMQKFIDNHTEIMLYEQGNSYVIDTIYKEYGKPIVQNKIHASSGDCPDRPDTWKVWDHLEVLFSALKSVNPSYVIGDVGQYTVESHHSIDACLCLGSSVGTTLGVALNGVSYPFCVVGDGAFTHGNILAVEEARNRGAAFGIIIIDNGGSQATGGQQLAIGTSALVAESIPRQYVKYESTDASQLAAALNEMRDSNTLSILHLNTEILHGH